MKKIGWLAFVLMVTVVLMAIPSVSADTVVEISTAQQLSDIRKDLDGQYRLVKDIVFSASDFKKGGAFYNGGAGWEPIGSSYTKTTAFTGTLDGNGHTITGLYINQTGDGQDAKFAGLFGHMNGTVKNLSLADVDITVTEAKSTRVGAIAGQSQGVVENISVSGRVNCVSGANTVAIGGAVGRQTKLAVISACNAAIDVVATGNTIRIGGILGENEGGQVIASQSTGKVDGDALYTLYIGGVVGHNHTSTSGSKVTKGAVSDCLRNGETVGFAKSSIVGGGLVGWNEGSILNNSITMQTVSFTGNTGVTAGQVIGDNDAGTATGTYYVQNDAGFSAIGSGAAISAKKLAKDFTKNDIKDLIADKTVWSYQDGVLQLVDLPTVSGSPDGEDGSQGSSSTSQETTTNGKTTTTKGKTTTTKKNNTDKTSSGSVGKETLPASKPTDDDTGSTSVSGSDNEQDDASGEPPAEPEQGLQVDSGEFGEDDTTGDERQNNGISLTVWIVGGVVLVLAGAGVAFIVIRKKRLSK